MPKILVADDNTNIQKMVSLALEERGISVTAVGNGEAAVRRIPDLDPDLVLADIFMPVRNGYEVCEFVKKDERFAHVPVILLVGAFDPLDEKEARRVGADGVLKKPFVPPDPLIAMVTSALEKNPRVAAELAKAKEAKMAPPVPLPSVDLSMRPEPKPLPEYPDPTPEEAALIYGMGKGHRALKDDEPGAADAEDEPPAPKLDPNVHMSHGDEEDEASTSSDWRRSAMNIEIPEDVASKPAIPSMDDAGPITFPSEKDYPPRRVRVPQPVEDDQPVVTSDFAMSPNGFSLRQIEEPQAKPETKIPELAIVKEHLKLPTEPELLLSTGLHPAADSAATPTAVPAPDSTAVGRHWLDSVAPTPETEPVSDWMNALVGGPAEPPAAAVTETPSIVEEPRLAAPPVKSSGASEISDGASPAETQSAVAPSVRSVPPQESEHQENDSFFADEVSAQEEQDEEVTASAGAVPSDFFAKAAAGADREIETEEENSQPSAALKDPALVEPPAVHVTPEPLLVDEEPSAPSRYGTPAEETAPLHSFFAPAADAPAIVPAPSAAVQMRATEFSIPTESNASAESSEEESDERIPTLPPPNREALSHIPFLTPPPSFLAEITSGKSMETHAEPDAATVDTVVQKVLEKLQPQIQELLSQGLLKPLVENILQHEIGKKR